MFPWSRTAADASGVGAADDMASLDLVPIVRAEVMEKNGRFSDENVNV